MWQYFMKLIWHHMLLNFILWNNNESLYLLEENCWNFFNKKKYNVFLYFIGLQIVKVNAGIPLYMYIELVDIFKEQVQFYICPFLSGDIDTYMQTWPRKCIVKRIYFYFSIVYSYSPRVRYIGTLIFISSDRYRSKTHFCTSLVSFLTAPERVICYKFNPLGIENLAFVSISARTLCVEISRLHNLTPVPG